MKEFCEGRYGNDTWRVIAGRRYPLRPHVPLDPEKYSLMMGLLKGISDAKGNRRLRRKLAALAFAMALGMMVPGFVKPARANTYNVGCTGGVGSVSGLIKAIYAANTNLGPDTVNLGANCIYSLAAVNNWWYGPNGLPPIASDITIEGNGATIQRDTSALPIRLRFFYVGADPVGNPLSLGFNTPGAGKLTLHNLTLKDGRQQGGDGGGGGGAGMGGAIFNQGTLILDSVTLTGNASVGGSGGYYGTGGGMGGPGGFGGSVTPAGSSGFGGGGNFGMSAGWGIPSGGGGGFGVSDNSTGSAGGGTPNGLGGSSYGSGGNGSGGGGGASLGYAFGGGVGGGGANGNSGGGGGFGGGGGSYYGNGGFGGGGGVGGAGGFGGGNGGGSYGGGGAGMGGAIFNHIGKAYISNSKLSGNSAQGGNGGNGGSGFGAALFNLNGTVTIKGSTISGNTVAAGMGNTGNGSANGALYNLGYDGNLSPAATVTIENSTISGTTGGKDIVNNKPSVVSGGLTNKGTASVITTPGVVSLTPSLITSTAGTSQNFSAVYKDKAGYSYLNTVDLLVGPSAGVSAIWLRYNRSTNKLFIASDAGSFPVTGCTPGAIATLSNSQGALNCQHTTVSGKGNNLTVRWNVKPKVGFASPTAKNIRLIARDGFGGTSGWVTKGSWTIKTTNTAPTIGTLSPSSLTSAACAAQTFTSVYSDADGYANLKTVEFRVGPSSGANAIWVRYDRNVNKLYLKDDAGMTLLGGCTPGTWDAITNSQGEIDCHETTVSGTGNDLTVTWKIFPYAAFASPTAKTTSMKATDNSGATTGWIDKGSWTITSDNPPTIGTLTPSSLTSAVGTAKTFTAVYTDADGYANLGTVEFRMSLSSNINPGVHAIWVRYDRRANSLAIWSDDGSGISQSCSAGLPGIIGNSQGTISCLQTTVSGAGNDLTLTLYITPKIAFESTTPKTISMNARDNCGKMSGWVNKGSWTILLP